MVNNHQTITYIFTWKFNFVFHFVHDTISRVQATTRYQIPISHHTLVTHQLQQQAKPQQQVQQLQQQQQQPQPQPQPQQQQQTIQQTIANITARDNSGA